MKRILVWLEPHPIRNTFIEFLQHGKFFVNSLIQNSSPNIEARIFSNLHTIGSLTQEYSDLSDSFLCPTEAEDKIIFGYHGRWDKKTMGKWTELIRGKGEITTFYLSVLERIYKKFPFDCVVLWSDNGAVRKFALENSIPTLNFELGPTRPPFMETFYMDPRGTNGWAAIRDVPLGLVEATDPLPAETWNALATGTPQTDPAALEYPPYLLKQLSLPTAPYVYLPLQLADDLNTLIHSPYATPLEYLQTVLPLVNQAGYVAVVKAHPDALARPSNLVAETAALEYVRSFGEDAVVMERGSAGNLSLLHGAACVGTINSSVGFETLLLGRRAILFGDAAYDVASQLKVDAADLKSKICSASQFDHDKTVTFLMRHYLHPYTPDGAGKTIEKAVNLIIENGTHTLDASFWRSWAATFDYGKELTQSRLAAALIQTAETSEQQAQAQSLDWRNALQVILKNPIKAPRILYNQMRQARRKKRRAKDDYQLIVQSGLFDRDYYLKNNPDVAESGVDPAYHYLHHGGLEGRAPSPAFNSAWYRRQNLDVAEAKINPLVHYISAGQREGRAAHPGAA